MSKKPHVDTSKEPIKINDCCKYDEILSLQELKKRFDPLNTNTHSPESIKRMSKVLKFQGFDKAVIVSTNTGTLNQGHKRIMAAELLKQKWIPVIWREFDSIDQERAASISDNSTAQESKIDLSIVNQIVLDFDPIVLTDPDVLGLPDFTPVAEDSYNKDKPKKDKQCPHCGEKI